ncbi:MAG: indole-3-glycerol phosphate synthase TrpC [Acetobacter sp.]|nr:indole-3-glycerol phosphate synthase TrpC [Acetobacter sp.]
MTIPDTSSTESSTETPVDSAEVSFLSIRKEAEFLTRIRERTLIEIEHRSTLLPFKEIVEKAQDITEETRGFGNALKEKSSAQQIGLIAEIKKASPSAGILIEHYDPAEIARSYEKAGAACLSVLTESSCFHGSNEDLTKVHQACSLPILRKDFILDPWQVYESRIIGADCILLIMAVLSNEQASELIDHARGMNIDVLLEVHNEEELNRALAFDTFLIGINNRNLNTLKTDITVTERLVSVVPPDRIIVSESGIKTHAEIERLSSMGVTGFLVGEALLKCADHGKAVKELLGEKE